MRVFLTPSQMMLALLVGGMRQISNLKKGRADAHGSNGKNDWQLHVEGCLGELALASHLGLFWDGKLHDLSSGDIGAIEVRTRSEDWHDLIVHKEDADDARFYLLTGRNGVYQIRGFILGSEAKRPEFWKDPAGGRPAYFVPQSKLTEAQPQERIDHA